MSSTTTGTNIATILTTGMAAPAQSCPSLETLTWNLPMILPTIKGSRGAQNMGPEDNARITHVMGQEGWKWQSEDRDNGGRDKRELLGKVTESGGCHRETTRRVLDEITQFVIWTVPLEVRSCSVRAQYWPWHVPSARNSISNCREDAINSSEGEQEGVSKVRAEARLFQAEAGLTGGRVRGRRMWSHGIHFALCSALEKYRPGFKGWNDFNLTFLFRGDGY